MINEFLLILLSLIIEYSNIFLYICILNLLNIKIIIIIQLVNQKNIIKGFK